MNMLIVYAHPEPKSLNGAMKELAISVLTSQGHDVIVSDLYEMNFHPVLGPGDFQSINDMDSFHPIREQIHGADLGYNPDIEEEHRKLVWADIVIFQFPLWWRNVPTIMKGYFDRILSAGFAYGGTRGRYQTGGLVGKKAMLAFTAASSADSFKSDGIAGHLDMLLYPIQQGILWYTGMQVLEPFIVFGVDNLPSTVCEAHLERYTRRLLSLPLSPTISYPPRIGDVPSGHSMVR